jgi:predicted pyridoxine 5'-phosphate oxidase superfamily flavin-nucleotide-binding protein
MGKQLPALTDALVTFIEQQKLFFVATADDGRVNCSPNQG